MNVEHVIKELQDNLVVIAEIERRQSAMLKDHSEFLLANERFIAKVHAQSEVFQRRTDQNLAEITDKLNGLIGYMDGMRPPEKQ